MSIAEKDTFSTVSAPQSAPSHNNCLSAQLTSTDNCRCMCDCSKQFGYDTLAPKLIAGGLRRISIGTPEVIPPQTGCKHFASCPLNGSKCN